MTTDSELIALAGRVENATGDDRNLDREICPLVGIRVVDEGHPLGRCYYDENGYGVPLPAFTASLDAAMTLVPERFRKDISLSVSPMSIDMGGKDFKALVGGHKNRGSGRTFALALTAAALRARATMGGAA